MSTTDPTEPGTPEAAADNTTDVVDAEIVDEIVIEDAAGEPAAEAIVIEEAVVVEEPIEPAVNAPAPLIEPEPIPAPHTAAEAAGVIDEEVFVAEVVEEPVVPPAAAPAPPVAPPVQPAPPAAPQVVYVQPVSPPKKLHNRGVGTLLALGATVVFAALLTGATWVLRFFIGGATDVDFLTTSGFWLPVAVFVVAFLLLVLLANRANWWAYILGSIFVAVGVYFGTIGLSMLFDIVFRVASPSTFSELLVQPFIIIAALIAREVSMWFGSILARRGRKLTVRNAENKAAYQREAAERRAATGY